MRLISLPLIAFGMAACTGYFEAEPPAVPSDAVANDGGTCDAAPAQYHLGNTATDAIGQLILEESGARALRWGPPNTAWTMDYREDRVNVRYDDDMFITDIACG